MKKKAILLGFLSLSFFWILSETQDAFGTSTSIESAESNVNKIQAEIHTNQHPTTTGFTLKF